MEARTMENNEKCCHIDGNRWISQLQVNFSWEQQSFDWRRLLRVEIEIHFPVILLNWLSNPQILTDFVLWYRVPFGAGSMFGNHFAEKPNVDGVPVHKQQEILLFIAQMSKVTSQLIDLYRHQIDLVKLNILFKESRQLSLIIWNLLAISDENFRILSSYKMQTKNFTPPKISEWKGDRVYSKKIK